MLSDKFMPLLKVGEIILLHYLCFVWYKLVTLTGKYFMTFPLTPDAFKVKLRAFIIK